MYPSVTAYCLEFLERFEGKSLSMFLDSGGLVRVGVGMVVDPLSLAIRLPFVHRQDGTAATPEEITAAWQAVKHSRVLRHRSACGPAVQLDLIIPTADCDKLFTRRLERLVDALSYMVCEFADFKLWPADAQLALISLGWAQGPGFARRGRCAALRAACAAHDFKAAAACCGIVECSVSRNQAHRHLFTNAANVLDGALPLERLVYPAILLAPSRQPLPPGY